MNKRILVTGALGHIGSKLIHSISPGEFDEVRMIDNLSTQRYASLFHLPKGVLFKFYEDDILTADLEGMTKDIDAVIHLAAITDAPSSFERREEVEQVNYNGTKRVAAACVKNGVKLLFPSTTSVYGSQEMVVDETCSLRDLKPQSPYAEFKLKSEQVLKEMSALGGLKCVVCRFGTIFGTSIGMRFHTAVNRFCWQAVMGQPLTVWKTALDQKRPYLGIEDAISAIKFIIEKDLFDGEIYNVVSANNTVRDIVDHIKKTIAGVEIQMVDSKIMNQLSYHVSDDKIKKMGYMPQSRLEAGIKDTLKCLQSSL
ncbi:MAG: SDR family oxidoreductase [Candidatus Omnitrophota bacterium]